MYIFKKVSIKTYSFVGTQNTHLNETNKKIFTILRQVYTKKTILMVDLTLHECTCIIEFIKQVWKKISCLQVEGYPKQHFLCLGAQYCASGCT